MGKEDFVKDCKTCLQSISVRMSESVTEEQMQVGMQRDGFCILLLREFQCTSSSESRGVCAVGRSRAVGHTLAHATEPERCSIGLTAACKRAHQTVCSPIEKKNSEKIRSRNKSQTAEHPLCARQATVATLSKYLWLASNAG